MYALVQVDIACFESSKGNTMPMPLKLDVRA